MNIATSMIDGILKEMGVEPNKPARWKPHYYTSKAAPPIGGKRQDGWFCSKCGKYSCVKSSVCDGCNSKMPKESEVAERREDIENSPVDCSTPSVTDSKGERNEQIY